MKKNIFKFILLLLVIFSYSSVFADSDNNHIYVVKELRIEGIKMNISGYAFVSHMDNYGIKDGKGNLSNYLVAYTSNSVSLNSRGECSASDGSRCVAIPLTNKNNFFVDLYYSRCVEDAKNDGRGYCVDYEHDRYKLVDNDGKYFESNSASSCVGNCMYYNVGFNTTINNIKTDLVDKLDKNDDNEIKFMIYSIIIDNGKSKSYYSDFGVSEVACFIDDKLCESEKKYNIDNGLYKIKIEGLSNEFRFDASDAAAQTIKNGSLQKYKDSNEKDFRFYHINYGNKERIQYTYNIKEIDFKGRCIYRDGGCFEDIIYKLDVFETTTSYEGGSSNLIVPNKSDVIKDNGYTGKLNNNIWALGNWGQSIVVPFKITEFEPNYKELTCNNIKDKKSEKISVQTTCDDNPTANGEFYQCKRDNSVNATIYINLGNTKPTCGNFELRDLNLLSTDGTIVSGEGYVLPVNVKTAVLLEQTGTFNFANFSPELVYAGKGFSINNNVTNGISYNNTFRWLFGNVITETNNVNYRGTPYISYSGGLPKLVNGSCVEDTDYVSTVLKDAFADVSGNKNKILYEKDDKLYGATNILNAVVYAIDEVIKSMYDTSKFDEVQFESCDSNSKSSTCEDKIISGMWSESDDVNTWSFIFGDVAFNDVYAHRGFGIKREAKLEYQLPHAYVVLSDSKINGKNYKNGDKIYSVTELSDDYIATYKLQYVGNKYFVGFKYVYDKLKEFDFPVNIVDKNASLVDGMTWNLSGTCGVEVKNKFYKKIVPQCSKKDCGLESKISYKFRPISLSNPFPKSVAVNWQNWLDNNPDATRLKSTKDYGVKYRIRLSKFDVNDVNVVKISDIKSYSLDHGSYADLRDYNPDGSSSFVNKYFPSFKQSTTSYCGLGYFSSNCDQYANSMG